MRWDRGGTPEGVPEREVIITNVNDPQNWIWTGASDGMISVGWILRNFNYNDRANWDDQVTPYAGTPHVRITGLDSSLALELRWFDDRRGILLPGAATKPAGVNYLETDMPANVGKSMAFLIQPVGATGDPAFPELPNELIVQIDVNSPAPDGVIEWDAELAIVKRQRNINLTAHLKVANPGTCIYEWYRWGVDPVDGKEKWLLQLGQVDAQYEANYTAGEPSPVIMKVVIKNASGNYLSGDIIKLELRAQ